MKVTIADALSDHTILKSTHRVWGMVPLKPSGNPKQKKRPTEHRDVIWAASCVLAESSALSRVLKRPVLVEAFSLKAPEDTFNKAYGFDRAYQRAVNYVKAYCSYIISENAGESTLPYDTIHRVFKIPFPHERWENDPIRLDAAWEMIYEWMDHAHNQCIDPSLISTDRITEVPAGVPVYTLCTPLVDSPEHFPTFVYRIDVVDVLDDILIEEETDEA